MTPVTLRVAVAEAYWEH